MRIGLRVLGDASEASCEGGVRIFLSDATGPVGYRAPADGYRGGLSSSGSGVEVSVVSLSPTALRITCPVVGYGHGSFVSNGP